MSTPSRPPRLRVAAVVAVLLTVAAAGWTPADAVADCVAVVNITSFYARTKLLVVRLPASLLAPVELGEECWSP